MKLELVKEVKGSSSFPGGQDDPLKGDKKDPTKEYVTKYLRSKNFISMNRSDVEDNLSQAFENLTQNLNKLGIDSAFKLSRILNHYINIVVYRPLAGSYIDLPKALKHPTKRLLNIQNNDDKCFLWCHLAKIFQKKIPNLNL